ncbi:MAG: pantetheine-phosphate adenylyltransferase [Verrucomicrobiota bacterium]
MSTNQKIRSALYPGSFDPITNGHLDIIERALKLFDKVLIGIATNSTKNHTFSMEERIDLVHESIKNISGANRISIMKVEGLSVEFAVQNNCYTLIRGLRAVSDFEFEFQLALMNRSLNETVDTIFLMPKDNYTYLSSRIVKEIARLGGDISSYVPEIVEQKLKKTYCSTT